MPQRNKEKSDDLAKKATLAGTALTAAAYLENERRKQIPKYYEDRIAAVRNRAKGEIKENISHGHKRYLNQRSRAKKKNRGAKLTEREWENTQRTTEQLYPSKERNWKNKKGPAARHIGATASSTGEGMKKIEERYGKKLGVGFVTVKKKTAQGKVHSRRKAVPGVWKDGKFTPKTSKVTQILQMIPGLGGNRRTLSPRIFGLKKAPTYTSAYNKSLRKGPKRKGYRKQPDGKLYGREDKLGRFVKK